MCVCVYVYMASFLFEYWLISLCNHLPKALRLQGCDSDGSSQFTSESSKELGINSHLIGSRLGLELESFKSSPLKSFERFQVTARAENPRSTRQVEDAWSREQSQVWL